MAYCLNTTNYFLKRWENLPRGEVAKKRLSDLQTPVYAKAHTVPSDIKEKVEDELSNMVKQTLYGLFYTLTRSGFRICGDLKVL